MEISCPWYSSSVIEQVKTGCSSGLPLSNSVNILCFFLKKNKKTTSYSLKCNWQWPQRRRKLVYNFWLKHRSGPSFTIDVVMDKYLIMLTNSIKTQTLQNCYRRIVLLLLWFSYGATHTWVVYFCHNRWWFDFFIEAFLVFYGNIHK